MKYRALLEAGIAGYVDTLGFVALYGLFTVHVTGNFVLIGAALAGKGGAVAIKLAAFPAFVAGIAFAKLVAIALSRATRETLERVLLLLQAVGLCVFLLTGVVAHVPDEHGVETWPMILCGVSGAFAMAIQNALPKIMATPGSPTTVMTGNVTQAVLDAVSLVFDRDPAVAGTVRGRIITTLGILAGFAVGAIAGGIGYARAGFWALVVPVVVLVAIAMMIGPAGPVPPHREP